MEGEIMMTFEAIRAGLTGKTVHIHGVVFNYDGVKLREYVELQKVERVEAFPLPDDAGAVRLVYECPLGDDEGAELRAEYRAVRRSSWCEAVLGGEAWVSERDNGEERYSGGAGMNPVPDYERTIITERLCRAFTDLYKEEVSKPTPRQVFMERVQSATGAKPEAVRAWCEGRCVPYRASRRAIAAALGVDEDELFPEKRVRKG